MKICDMNLAYDDNMSWRFSNKTQFIQPGDHGGVYIDCQIYFQKVMVGLLNNDLNKVAKLELSNK